MKRRFFSVISAGLLALAAGLSSPALHAADEAPDEMIKRLSNELLDTIKADKSLQGGDMSKIMALVDTKVMPNLDFARMTASAVGPGWRQANPDQQKRLQEEFKLLLIRTYSGALAQVADKTVQMKPLRASPEDADLTVRSEIRGRGEPIQLDYRMSKTPGQGTGWKIYNINVLGVWLIESFRNQFAPEVNAKGIDGLIQSLSERNKANAAKKAG